MIETWERQRQEVSRVIAALPEAVRREWPATAVVVTYVAVALALLLISVLAALFDRFPGDVWLTREIQDLDVPGLRRAMRASTDATNPTNSLIALFVAVCCLAALRRPRLALFAVAALSAHVLGAVLKFFVDRRRPDPDLVDVVRIEDKYSYPSGHVEWAVAFEGFIVFAIWQLTPNRLVRTVAVVAWAAHVLLTSAGRIDQGLHWPSDVFASYLVGALALVLVAWSYRVSLRLVPEGSAA